MKWVSVPAGIIVGCPFLIQSLVSVSLQSYVELVRILFELFLIYDDHSMEKPEPLQKEEATGANINT